MEIERKYLLNELPPNLSSFPCHVIEQAYLCTDPVVRVRREDDSYYMTYKGKGLLARQEANLPLNKEAYLHLCGKADGYTISKKRYLIPLGPHLTAELDVFSGNMEGLIMAEVEFESEEDANNFQPPSWFGREVTFDPKYHNSNMSKMPRMDI